MYRFPFPQRICIILMIAYASLSSTLNAQQLNCNGQLSTSVGQFCDLALTPEQFIVGTYDVTALTLVYKKNGVVVDPSSDASSFIGQTLIFEIHDLSINNMCWGRITIEDKQDPVIDCGPCTDLDNLDPSCYLSCPSLDLFKELNRKTGLRGYDIRLLDQLIPTDPDDYVRRFVSDNCGQEVTAAYQDAFFTEDACTGSSLMTRTWTFRFNDSQGQRFQTCTQYFRFIPFEFAGDSGDPIIIEGDGTPLLTHILMPQSVVNIPTCNIGISPRDIASYFDNPDTEDKDSNDDGEDEVDCVIENNEGIIYAYPHYYMRGLPGNGSPDYHAQPLDSRVCNVNVYYNDTVLDACAPGCIGNTKVARTWSIIDWCSNQSFEYLQTIDISDGIGPEILVKDLTVSVDPWQCAADVLVPSPEHLIDNCDENITYEVKVLGQLNEIEVTKDGFIIKGVPLGLHTLQYTSSDCCGNVSVENVQLEVLDKTPPIPVTIENIIVDLTITDELGTAKVLADNIDNGSFDSCTGVVVQVRRVSPTCSPRDTIWGDFVSFCCEDLKASEFALVDVQFRVVDWAGNENLGWTTVRVEDKGTAMTCPLDVVLSCNDDFNQFENTGGIPMLFTACGEIPTQIDTAQVNNNTQPRRKSANAGNVPGYIGVAVPEFNAACGFGAIRRDFDLCTQWIVIEPDGEVFDPNTIEFPQDTTISCLEKLFGQQPIWQEMACNLVGSSVSSDTFRFESESCALIINEWTVIDWCSHNLLTGEGSFSFTQTVNLVDNTLPTLLVDEDLSFPVDSDCLSKGVILTAIAEDPGDCPSELLSWTVEIDLFKDKIIDFTYSTSAELLLPNGEPNPFRLERTQSKGQQVIRLPDGIIGSKTPHTVTWSVNDGCRNIQSTETTFLIEDQKPPTPYCLNLSTAVMENGEVELWAIDFNVASFDNCSDERDLSFTFTDVPPPPRCDEEYDGISQLAWYDTTFWFYDASAVDDTKQLCGVTGAGEYRNIEDYGGDIHRWEPGLRSSSKIFTADDIEGTIGLLMIPIYVWDGCQNIDFCTVNLTLSNNEGGISGVVGGQVTTEKGLSLIHI